MKSKPMTEVSTAPRDLFSFPESITAVLSDQATTLAIGLSDSIKKESLWSANLLMGVLLKERPSQPLQSEIREREPKSPASSEGPDL